MTKERRTFMETIVAKGLNEAFAISLDNYLKTEKQIKQMIAYINIHKIADFNEIICAATSIKIRDL